MIGEMRISGEFTFAADRQAVWDLLHDPEIIRSCIKGCESLAEIEPGAIQCGYRRRNLGRKRSVFGGRWKSPKKMSRIRIECP